VTIPDAAPPRKKLRVGHGSERAGINAVRTLLERHRLVVDEVDGRSDYGRDLNVDITLDGQITGGIIGVQVKSGATYFRKGRWVVPATPTDWEYWRSSTVPIIGMVYDPAEDVIRWCNLSRLARACVVADDENYAPHLQSDDRTEVPVTSVLNDDSFGEFVDHATSYLAATANSAYLLLVDPEDDARCRGIYNCWTLGRHDSRPLILLRHVLPSLEGRSFLAALSVLAHATSHPDILWTRQNWISPPVEEAVNRSFRWSAEEVLRLVDRFETMNEGGADWYRGGSGQNLWSIMVSDRGLRDVLPRAIREAVESQCDRAATRLLIWYQYLARNPRDDVEELVAETPGLLNIEEVGWVVEAVRSSGRFEIFA
jgi:Domain of unknown function (DUF4365)